MVKFWKPRKKIKNHASNFSHLVDSASETPITMTLVNYSKEDFLELENVSASECQDFLDQESLTWIHVQGQPKPAELRELGSLFNLHPLAMEDIITEGERSKADIFDDQIMIILGMPTKQGHKIVSDQVTIFLGKNFLVSFHTGSKDPFRAVRRRLSHPQSTLRTSHLDYLLYVLLDVTVDHGFPILEEFAQEIEAVEQQLLGEQGVATFHSLYTIKRELLVLRLKLNPQREAIGIVLRDDKFLLNKDTKIYLRDVYDHAIRLNEVLEIYRDMITNMLDVYLSLLNRLSYESNEVQRKATVWAMLFAPLTFITGVYGMNFVYMPELHLKYAYPTLLTFMGCIVVFLLRVLKRKKWL